jgi:hypothetical protein
MAAWKMAWRRKAAWRWKAAVEAGMSMLHAAALLCALR